MRPGSSFWRCCKTKLGKEIRLEVQLVGAHRLAVRLQDEVLKVRRVRRATRSRQLVGIHPVGRLEQGTGLCNFGNGCARIGHLQQYEPPDLSERKLRACERQRRRVHDHDAVRLHEFADHRHAVYVDGAELAVKLARELVLVVRSRELAGVLLTVRSSNVKVFLIIIG